MKSLKELLTILNEHIPNDRVPHVHSPGYSPPNILILKRKTVRSYSNTERVALYYNEKLQRYFSVPFTVGRDDDRDDIVGVSEEQLTELKDTTLRSYVKKRHGQVQDTYDKTKHPKKLALKHFQGLDTAGNKLAAKALGEETSQEASAKRSEQVSKTWANRRKRWNDWKTQQQKPAAPKDVKESVIEGVITEDAISHLKKVKEFGTDKPLYHKDGSQTRVDPTTAHALLTVHGALHPDNQKKMADGLEHSKAKFNRILDFAWKQVK